VSRNTIMLLASRVLLTGTSELAGWPTYYLLLSSPGVRVPHSCVLCKGGNHGPILLMFFVGIELRAAQPFAQNAKGWGTLHSSRARQRRERQNRKSRRIAAAETGTVVVLRNWSQLLPMNWKKPSCAASAANWNRRAWLEAGKRRRCSRSCAVRKKSAATILVLADPARSTRSATGRNQRYPGCPTLVAFFATGWGF